MVRPGFGVVGAGREGVAPTRLARSKMQDTRCKIPCPPGCIDVDEESTPAGTVPYLVMERQRQAGTGLNDTRPRTRRVPIFLNDDRTDKDDRSCAYPAVELPGFVLRLERSNDDQQHTEPGGKAAAERRSS